MTTRILFVCMGNICRSPTAEGVFRKLVPSARRTSRSRSIRPARTTTTSASRRTGAPSPPLRAAEST